MSTDATVTAVTPSDGCTTVDLEWSTSDHAVTDFDLTRCGRIWKCGREHGWASKGYVLIADGPVLVRVGDTIPLLPAED